MSCTISIRGSLGSLHRQCDGASTSSSRVSRAVSAPSKRHPAFRHIASRTRSAAASASSKFNASPVAAVFGGLFTQTAGLLCEKGEAAQQCEQAGSLTNGSTPPPAPRAAATPRAEGQRPGDAGDETDLLFTLGWPEFDRERYHAEGLLGSGGYGTVYLATDSHTGELVAVKRIPKIRKKSAPAKVQRNLIKEARLLEELQFSPLVVSLLDKYEDDRNAYLVMEHLQGGSLEDYVHKHRRELSEADMATIAQNVFKFLAGCHDAKVVFADIKPSNFMLARDSENLCEMKAIDFGCSQQQEGGESLSSRTGTFKYFAPEVYRQRYGTEADNWSTGIMLYRLMVGAYPWWGPTRSVTPSEAMEDICSGDPVPFVDEQWSSYSPLAKDFVKMLLQKNTSVRMTAKEALQHPWLQRFAANPTKKAAWPANNVIPLKRDHSHGHSRGMEAPQSLLKGFETSPE
mmetsp:Transcript_10466/g.29763  ORF Transcript_10466/g.29763 Transcript_10466/m.29763 type:complete len:458 (+) Transcript_10466:332-1705(+)|eukprot:CAMPEP_0117673624 /NCGR_PEP_ID=MMETSP0804-20121206/14573_1 /TAXON_ID=1074897 /ORGANISM="Tetraselmis astigmatica, Strain CCMP880" /LENGTH=457 /DNA_ID=CAMNT_0005482377 /DNA_START=284 /DNA_END=1657 /DNA_ORIENTATION=+